MPSANKPVNMEEFGLTYMGTRRADNDATWYDTVISTGLTGDLLWCVFSPGLVGGGRSSFRLQAEEKDSRLRLRKQAGSVQLHRETERWICNLLH